ncbi:hypothetical protein R1flu_023864 [Riccia fluitans]|uniref:Uncharacterized protein n=1 Tax=Riccia fluitans TaxID=41844 RepID=A0ABD1XT85_9MARC
MTADEEWGEADEATGQKLPTIRLVDEDLYKANTTEQIRRFCSRIQFVPYSFKELKDVDHVKILAMYCMNMLKYITSLQRHFVLEDIFLWGITNTDAEGDRLLVKDTRDGTNIIGWNKIAVVFGAKHNEKEDFRSITVMHTTLDKYNPRSYLLAPVETNPNKKLVNVQRYEEILYYKDAAPFGPTYHLMTTVAELFWSTRRSNRFLIPMILAYLRGLHGHLYNWTKAILYGLRTKILFMQSKAHNNEGGKTIPVVWAPCFVHILFLLRRTLFVGTPLEEAEGWRCKLPEEIPIASSEQSMSTKRPCAEDNERGLLSTKKNKTELEEYKRSSEASIKRLNEEASCLWEALAAKESVVQALENAHQKEISTLKATCQKYKTTLDGEIGTNADLHAQVQNLEDELNASKYTQEQALQA